MYIGVPFFGTQIEFNDNLCNLSKNQLTCIFYRWYVEALYLEKYSSVLFCKCNK